MSPALLPGLVAIFILFASVWRYRWMLPPAIPSSLSHPKIDAFQVTNYRLRGIPFDCNRSDVQQLLVNALDLESKDQVNIRSLANSPYLHQGKVATLTFSSTPDRLSKTGVENQWKLRVSKNNLQDGESINLVLDTHFRDFTPLHTGDDDAEYHVDVIAISGLGGHAFGSFKKRGSSYMWLRDSLPGDLPGTRIFTYGYDSFLPGSASSQSIQDLGRQLRDSIKNIRTHIASTQQIRPLIFIGHSLGGIVIKQALIEMYYGEPSHQANLKSVFGLLLFGVPSQGMAIESLLPIIDNQPNRQLVESFGKGSTLLKDQQRSFPEKFPYRDSKVISFYETKASPTAMKNSRGQWTMNGPLANLVDQYSATFHRPWEMDNEFVSPINRNHSDIVKFSEQDEYYNTVLNRLLAWNQDCHSVIKGRFLDQEANKSFRFLNEDADCLRSLYREENDFRRYKILTTANSYAWLSEHEGYKTWQQQQQGLLWISGKPGAGKSTLMKFISSDIGSRLSKTKSIVISFFFNARGSGIERSPFGLIYSLLHQLLVQFPEQLAKLTAIFKERCQTRGEFGKAWNWQFGELREFFSTAICVVSVQSTIHLFVDALDESGDQNAIELVEWFLHLNAAIRGTQAMLKICFSCRHYPIIAWNHGPAICVEDENNTDIRRYVKSELTGSFQGDDLRLLEDIMLKKADGVFQWVVLVVPRLKGLQRRGKNYEHIVKSLTAIPSDLDRLYEELLKKSDDNGDRDQTVRLLQWICFATRPLTVRELRHAMALDPLQSQGSVSSYQASGDYAASDDQMERRLIDLSKGLAEVKAAKGKRSVQFIHQSVNDYLVIKGFDILQASQPCNATCAGHFRLSRSCIAYLSLRDRQVWAQQNIDEAYFKFPLLEYVNTSWTIHTKHVEEQGWPQTDILSAFRWPSNDIIECWTRIFYKSQFHVNRVDVEGFTLMHVSARYGFESVVSAILDISAPELNSTDANNQTPLLLAAISRRCGVVRLLLQQNGLMIEIRDIYGRTPLLGAVQSGATDIVHLLLKHGAAVNVKSKSLETPITSAVYVRSEPLVRLLLQNGADIDIQDQSGWTPLFWAVYDSSIEITLLLLEHGANIEARDLKNRTPLIEAVRHGDVKTVQLLLEHGADVNAQDMDGCTPLVWAVRERSEVMGGPEIVRLLQQQQGIRIRSKDKLGRTPLHWAAMCGREEIIDLLLKQGESEINMKDKSGHTALSMAAMSRHTMAVAVLLRQDGVQINTRQKDGWTPLFWAVYHDDTDLIDRLLTHRDVEINARDEDNSTPLFWGAMHGCSQAVKRLLECEGLDVNAKDLNSRTPLSLAAKFGHLEVVDLLLRREGVEVNPRDKKGRTPLHLAKKHADVVKLLLQRGGVDIEVRDPERSDATGRGQA